MNVVVHKPQRLWGQSLGSTLQSQVQSQGNSQFINSIHLFLATAHDKGTVVFLMISQQTFFYSTGAIFTHDGVLFTAQVVGLY